VTSLNTTLSAIASFRASGEIYTVAEAPGPWTKFLGAVAIINALISEASTVLTTVQNAYAVKLANAQADQMRKSGALNIATDTAQASATALQTAKTSLLSALSALPDDASATPPGPKSVLMAALAAFEAKRAQLAADRATLATAVKAMGDAQRLGQPAV